MKNAIISIGLVISGGLAPVVPTDMELLYSYQVPYQDQFDTVLPPGSPPTDIFEDTDGNGLVSVSAFADHKGNVIKIIIPDSKYTELGTLGGYEKNPKKDEYLSLFETLVAATPVSAAIAFDATSTNAFTAATSITFAHTTAGSNRLLLVGTTGRIGTDDINSVTYNSVALTKIAGSRVPSDRATQLWYLKNPTTGANNIVVSGPTSGMAAIGFSYTGAAQTGGADNSTTNTGTALPDINTTLTTVQDQDWTFIYAATAGNFNVGNAAGATIRGNVNTYGAFDSNGAKTPPGNTSMTVDILTSTDSIAIIMAAFPPLSTGTATLWNFWDF